MTESAPATPSEPESEPFDRQLAAFVAGVGLALALALEVVHVLAYAKPSASSFCTLGARFDCNTVALSRWAVLLGVPLPIWGVAGFLALGLTAWWRSTVFLYLSAVAAAVSLVLLGIELFAVHSVCLICEAAHAATWALFALAWVGRRSLTRTDGVMLFHLFTVPVAIVIASHFLTEPYWALFATEHGVSLPHGVDAQGHRWIGAETPKVTAHEYVDYSCPHCAVVASAMRTVVAQHPKALRVVRHQFAHMRCRYAPQSSACEFVRAAACADEQGKFWEMDAWLFQHGPGKTTLDYADAIRSVELDAAKFNACLPSERTFERVDAEYTDTMSTKISGTPTYIVDGKHYDGGLVLEELKKRL